MEIIAHAVVAALVSDDDGDDVVALGHDSMIAWLSERDLRPGNEILVVRGRLDEDP